jgi:hypothetical protein
VLKISEDDINDPDLARNNGTNKVADIIAAEAPFNLSGL